MNAFYLLQDVDKANNLRLEKEEGVVTGMFVQVYIRFIQMLIFLQPKVIQLNFEYLKIVADRQL